MRVWVSSIVFMLLVLLLPACGSAGGSGSTPPTVDPASYTDLTAQHAVAVKASDDVFTPQYAKVRKGTTITFENGGRNRHNVIPATAGSFEKIGTDAFAPGAKVKVVFDRPGTFDYYCSLHGTPSAGMHGSVLVVP